MSVYVSNTNEYINKIGLVGYFFFVHTVYTLYSVHCAHTHSVHAYVTIEQLIAQFMCLCVFHIGIERETVIEPKIKRERMCM